MVELSTGHRNGTHRGGWGVRLGAMGNWEVEQDELWTVADDGVLTVRELVELGVSRRTIAHRCRYRGPWKRLLPGVVLLSGGRPSTRQRIRAALAYAGESAVLTGMQAVVAHGLRRVPADDAVHVLVPHRRQRSSSGFVVIERTQRLPQPTSLRGVPVAPVERAVLDAVRRLTDRRVVCALLADAVQSGHTTPERLRAELEAGSGRGSALPREVLREDLDAGVRSTAESDARRLLIRSALPTPLWNPALLGPDGRFLGYPDAWFDDVALAWQIDSYAFHLSPADYAATLERDAAMVAEGVVVVRTLPTNLRRRPERVLARLVRAHRQAALRPRPSVHARPRAA